MMVRKEVLVLMGVVLTASGLATTNSAVNRDDLRGNSAPEGAGAVHQLLSNVESRLQELYMDQHKIILSLIKLNEAVEEELPKLKAELQEQKTENEQRFLTLNQKIDELKAEIDKVAEGNSFVIQYLKLCGFVKDSH